MWYILILLRVNLMMPKLSSSSSTRSVERKEKIEKKIKIETVFLERGLRLLRRMATNEDVKLRQRSTKKSNKTECD